MRNARWIFTIAGIYGLIVLTPGFFLEGRVGRDDPPAVTHPEYYYGFVGIAVAWQVAFLIIASNPVRFRPLMLAAILEKASFAIACPVLYAMRRVSTGPFVFSMVDMLLGFLFALAFVRTPSR